MTGDLSVSDIQAAIEAGKEIGAGLGQVEQMHEAFPFTVLPDGYHVEPLKPFLRDTPERIIAKPSFADAGSFIAYVNRFKDPATTLFADAKALAIYALIDYHDGDVPAWTSHRATLQLQHSPEWSAWKAQDRKPQTQEAFAEFLEDHIADIAEPDAGVLNDAVTKFQTVRIQSTKAIRNLATGEVQLGFTDEDKGAEGVATVPGKLVLGLRYFRGGDKFAATARLRYKPISQGVSFTYLIDSLEAIAEQSFAEVCAAIAEATEIPVLFGTP